MSTGAIGTGAGLGSLGADAAERSSAAPDAGAKAHVRFVLNGEEQSLDIDPRVTLLDALRDRIGLAGTKKGCDRGQCGACTVIVDGRRVNACLTLAATLDGARVTSVEGLARGGRLHPVQEAFVKHDAFQCGFCTPGQVMSCVALLEESRAGTVSAITRDLRGHPTLSDDEIRERMSGNICRCGAYVNIVAAVREAAGPATHGSKA